MKSILIILIGFYQKAISPSLGHRCRFIPSCSEFAIDAITEKGAFWGILFSFKRIIRCHPWGGHGLDPFSPAKRKK